MNWFLAELLRIARHYQWHYAACNRQYEVELIAHRIWQQAGCPVGHHEAHWWQAEKEFCADKPIRGLVLHDPKGNSVGQSVSPLQAVVHAQQGAVLPLVEILKLAGNGLALTACEARAVEEASNGGAKDFDEDLRRSIEQTVGLGGQCLLNPDALCPKTVGKK